MTEPTFDLTAESKKVRDTTRQATMWWGTEHWTEDEKKAYLQRILEEQDTRTSADTND